MRTFQSKSVFFSSLEIIFVIVQNHLPRISLVTKHGDMHSGISTCTPLVSSEDVDRVGVH